MEGQEYEFSSEQNAVITSLAKRMKFIGVVLLALAALYFAAGFYPFLRSTMPGWYGIGSIIGHAIGGAVYLAIGIFTIKAARSFRLIVETQGSDIHNLMDALAFLLKQYAIQYWIILVALILLVVSLVLVFVASMARG
jgi:hypothetical protein